MAKKKPLDIPVDIRENWLNDNYHESFVQLLRDHTTQENIFWATDSYAERGAGYGLSDPITIEAVTGDNGEIVRPRARKSLEEQTRRVKDKAEVFTPSWVCNAQNNLVDEAWFGRPDVFNCPDPDNPHEWIDTEGDIVFPDTEGKTWKDYVAARRIEITCGEAPYLVSRYDTVSGEPIRNLRHRIGLLDRKLIVVGQNTTTSAEWLLWAKIALRATYGFEWQGDNLLLAREALFVTFMEFYFDKFDTLLGEGEMKGAAYIISWNLWQMDGLKYGLPGYDPTEKTDAEIKKIKAEQSASLFPDEDALEALKPENIKPRERLCRIKDFIGKIDLHRDNLTNQSFKDKGTRQQKFLDVINENKSKKVNK